jgi:cytochrome c-type biogenesis protein CcmH/NrfF
VKTAIVAALAALALAAPAAACAPRASQADLETKLVCVECHTTLDQSSSPFAAVMKSQIAKEIAKCKTTRQILDAMVAQFGPTVLSTPQTHGFDLLAWILPLGGIALGAGALGLGARHWSRLRAAGVEEPGLDPDDERRVDEELERFDG